MVQLFILQSTVMSRILQVWNYGLVTTQYGNVKKITLQSKYL